MKYAGRLIILLLLAVQQLSAQSFYESDKLFSIGIGFNNRLINDSLLKSKVVPLSVSFEKGFREKISFGGTFTYSSATYSEDLGMTSPAVTTYRFYLFSVKASYYLVNKDKFNVYGSTNLGFNYLSTGTELPSEYKGKKPEDRSGGLVFGLVAGGRYHFMPRLAAFSEIGLGLSYVTIGLVYKPEN